jgi:uncharacterized protein (DUF433 family)
MTSNMGEEIPTASIDRSVRIVIDKDVSFGRERSVQGTGVGISTILHLRSQMGTEDQVARYLSELSFSGAQRAVSTEDVRACCLFAAKLSRRNSLSPPASARLMRDESLDDETLREVAVWAPQILEHFGRGNGHDALMAELPHADERAVQLTFVYAAHLAADEPLLGQIKQPAADSHIRTHLTKVEMSRVEEFCVYQRSVGLSLLMPTPEDWIQRWKELVEAVEAGHEVELDELNNYLTVRDLLEDTALLLSPSGRTPMREAIHALDLRYEAATGSTDVSLMGSRARWEPRRWWWFRAPLRSSPRLIDDLRARGIQRLESAD